MRYYQELNQDIYETSNSKVYVESWVNAKNELKELETFITAEVGEVITERLHVDTNITIFQSVGECFILVLDERLFENQCYRRNFNFLGNALEDATVGEMIYGKFVKGN